MGAWGTGNFDNDTACDWAGELKESSGLILIEKNIDSVFEDDYVDSDVGCEGLAAIDTLARLNGQIGEKNSHTEVVDNWVARQPKKPSPEIIQKSVKALDRIVSESSALYELWEVSKCFSAWKLEMKYLRQRLLQEKV